MESNKSPARIIVPAELKAPSYRIEQWCRKRPHLMAMPESLWTLAVDVATQYGVARVARFLRLDYHSLRERTANREQGSRATSEAKPTFIELQPLPVHPVSGCMIELEHPRGCRMKIHIKGEPMPDVTALSRALWGMKS